MQEKILDQIIKLILNHKNAEKIILYGSRSRGDNKNTSDIDIAIMDKNWKQQDINIVKSLLEEDIPTLLQFDLVNYYLLSNKKLQNFILKEGTIIYEKK